MFEACTQQYECIVLDTRQAAKKPMDSVFYYKARVINEPFRVGRPIFWRLSEHYFADNSDYSMDVSKVLGVPERRMRPEDIVIEEPKIIKKPISE